MSNGNLLINGDVNLFIYFLAITAVWQNTLGTFKKKLVFTSNFKFTVIVIVDH